MFTIQYGKARTEGKKAAADGTKSIKLASVWVMGIFRKCRENTLVSTHFPSHFIKYFT